MEILQDSGLKPPITKLAASFWLLDSLLIFREYMLVEGIHRETQMSLKHL